jgi:uncharacterized protein (DUF1015 family)
MAVIRPFRAVRPSPEAAAGVAAVPYDVVDTEEARALAAGNSLSFLHVSRAEIDLPAEIDPHADIVYVTAAARYRALKARAAVVIPVSPRFGWTRSDRRGRVLFAGGLRRERHQEA